MIKETLQHNLLVSHPSLVQLPLNAAQRFRLHLATLCEMAESDWLIFRLCKITSLLQIISKHINYTLKLIINQLKLLRKNNECVAVPKSVCAVISFQLILFFIFLLSIHRAVENYYYCRLQKQIIIKVYLYGFKWNR